MQLKYSNYVAFSHTHGFAVNNSGLFMIFMNFSFFIMKFSPAGVCSRDNQM